MNLVQQYDAIYTARPDKWTSGDRDRWAMNVINDYLHKEPGSAIDIGCGNGHTLRLLSHYWKNTSLHGIDLSPVAITIASEEVPNAILLAVPLLEYWPPHKFDVVLSMGVSEHFEDLPAHMGKLRELVAEDGILYMEVPNNLSYSSTREEGFRGMGPQTEWHLKRSSWEKIITEAGFKIQRYVARPGAYWEFIWILTPA
jgi:trans-aconitate methyltransferase